MMSRDKRDRWTSFTGYPFYFTGDFAWHIISVEEEKPLLNRMAEIAGLQAVHQNNNPKLFVTRSHSPTRLCRKMIIDFYADHPGALPGDGWMQTDFHLVKIFTHPDVPDVLCCVQPKRDITCDWVIFSFVYYQIYKDLLLKGGFPLHGGLIEYDGMGIVLAGPSGTGKTTCCRRVPNPWNSVCDDEVMIVPQSGFGYKVHPVPTWSDYFFDPKSKSTWDVNKGYPVSALFFLEKSEADDAVHMGQGKAALRIYQSSMESFSRYFPYVNEAEQRSIRRKVFESSCVLASKISCYVLKFSRNGFFWKNIESEISKLYQDIAVNI